MADNLTANPGTGGATLAFDDIAGVHVARVKVQHGVDGAAVDASGTDPLPITAAQLTLLAEAIRATNTVFTDGDKGIFILGKRRDTDTTLVGNDDYCGFNFDSVGRLKVASQPGDYAATTGNITANGQTVFIDVRRLSNLMIHCTGTFAGANNTFEASLNSTNGTDGNWFAVQAVRSNANTIELTTGVLAAAPAYAWELSVNGVAWFRTRATAFTSGTQVWTFLPGTYATEPIPASQISGTQPVSGTVTVATTTNIPSTAQGASTTHHLISAATTNATSVKATVGVINNIVITNASAAIKYFKLYNKASAPTVGTDVPVMTVGVRAGDSVQIPCGPWGLRLATGIAYALTGGITVADTTAVALSDLAVHINYT